jgi:hypothetical protein
MNKKILLSLTCIIALITTSNAQNALNFDGADDVIQTTNSGVLSSNDRTFEAWVNVNVNAPASNLTILDYGLNVAGSRNTFVIDGNLGLRYISGGTNANINSPAGTITAGQWTHVALVIDNGTGFLYVNGIQVVTGSLSSVNTPSGNANVTIGERVSGGSIPFSGSIDEVRIWDVARTPAEIMASMNSELCSYPSSLIAYYKFNQGFASGNNQGQTSVIGETGDTAVANNFAMIGSSSNWVSGPSISSIVPFNLGVNVDTNSFVFSALDTSASTQYQWYDCTTNSILVGDTNRTYTTRSGGNFAVILSNSSCSDTSACYTISSSGGGNSPGEAVHFDGVDDYIQTTFPGVLDTTNRTFEAWINIDQNAPSSNLTILDYGLNAVGSRNTFIIDGNRNLRFLSGGTNGNLPASSSTIAVNKWVHVAFVLDNGTGFLYIDGIQESTASLSGVNTPSGNANLTIGQRVSGGSIPFAGSIDDVRVWDIARSQSEIFANMNAEFCGSIPGLVAHFDMNGGIAGGNNSTITTVLNSVKSGDGVLTNFTLTGMTSNFVNPGAMLSPLAINTAISQFGHTLTAIDTTVDSYQWFDCSNNMFLQGDTLSSFSATVNGNYGLILTKNGCADTSSCFNVIGVGIEDSNFKNSFYLSQNPVKESFQLINNNGVKVNAFVRDITGKLIYQKWNENSTRIEFDMSEVKSGIYILTVEGNKGQTKNYKIVKK